MRDETRHPAFLVAESLPEPWRSHFPKDMAEANHWKSHIIVRALAERVLAVAKTRIECAWAAYVGDVPGLVHDAEWFCVLIAGAKLDEPVARSIFPELSEVPYAR